MTDDPKQGDRIAKVLARAGVSSRREAERLIATGAVSVNGKVIDSPALNIGPRDRVTVNGRPVAAAEPPRMWLYYKPLGLVTTERDELGRDTVFENLPDDMPRVISVGRLDLNSEGLLLLTNDGEIKRRLELPSTGWLRKYRVRVNGRPEDADLEPLRRGITIEGENFAPMQVVIDRQQGANAWLTIGLREGRNREIRRAMEAVNLTVNRLIRVSYGPFKLDDMEPGEVREVKARVLRDQLGLKTDASDGVTVTRKSRPGPVVAATAAGTSKARKRPSAPPDLTSAADPSASLRPPRAAKPGPAKGRPPREERGANDARPFRSRDGGDAPARDGGDRPRGKPAFKSEGFKSRGKPGERPARAFGDEKPRRDRPPRDEDKPRSAGFRSHEGARKPRADRAQGGKDAPPARSDSPSAPRGPRAEGGKAARYQGGSSDRPRSEGFKSDRPRGDGPRTDRAREDRPRAAPSDREGHAGRKPQGGASAGYKSRSAPPKGPGGDRGPRPPGKPGGGKPGGPRPQGGGTRGGGPKGPRRDK